MGEPSPRARVALSGGRGEQGAVPGKRSTGRRASVAEDERRIPLKRAMRILELFASADQSSWGVRELARALDMPPSSTHRLLAMLEEASIVQSEHGAGRYSVTLDFYRLASRLALRIPIRQIAGDHLRELAERTGESVYLARYDRHRLAFMFIDYVQSIHPLRYELALYEWMDLRVGAGGLGILAFLPPDELELVLSQPEPQKLTELTVTDRRVIEEELAEFRRRGYVVSIGRRVAGTVGIAAPIFGARNVVLGAVVLVLPESRLPNYEVPKLAADVVSTAASVSALLSSPGAPMAHVGRELASW